MIRKDGKVYDRVKELLLEAGYTDLDGLAVFTTNRGPYHTVIINDEAVGEFCHVSGELSLYD